MLPPDVPPQRWRLVPYIAPDGKCPVNDELLDSLRENDPKAYLKFRECHARALEEHGPSIGEPRWKGLDDGLYEICWNGKNRGHNRIYCSPERGKRIVMFGGDIKRWGKFDRGTRKVCKARQADFRSPTYDQEQREISYMARRRGRQNGVV